MQEISEKKSGKLQVWLIFMCVFAYTVSYVSRYSYNANIVAIREYYGADNASAGLAGTFYFFAYGAGQVVNGLLCRRYNKKYCIAAALLISAAMNALLFFSPAFAAYKWLWLINGAALSVLWSSLVSVLAAHLSDGYLKQGVLFMSMSVAIGTCISYGTSALFMKIATFRWFFVYDGLTKPLQSERNAERAEETAKTGQSGRIEADAGTRRKARVRGGDLAAVFIVPGVLAAIVNLIKDGLNTWVPEILKTSFGYGNSLSLTLTLVLPLLGMGGSALALWLHKKIGNFLILCGVIYLAETFAVAGITAILRSGNTGAAAGGATVALFGGVSLFAHSVNGALTSVAPMLLREKYESGKLAGILNGSAYVGSTISAYGLGAIADKSGWNGVFLLLLALSALATVLSFAVPALEKLWKKKGENEAKK